MKLRAAYAVLAVSSVISGARAAPTVSECLRANEDSIRARERLSLREAQRELTVCASTACPADVSAECTRRLASVADAIPTLVFAARTSEGQDLTDVDVTMDGQPLARVGAAAIAVDPGDHVFVFTAPGRDRVTRSLLVREGEKDRREVVFFDVPPRPQAPIRRHDPNYRIAGGTLMGVGAAGIVTGAVLGAMAAAAYSAQQSACGTSTTCPDRTSALSDHAAAVSLAAASTVAFIAGGILGVAGLVVFLGAPLVSPRGVGGTVGLDLRF